MANRFREHVIKQIRRQATFVFRSSRRTDTVNVFVVRKPTEVSLAQIATAFNKADPFIVFDWETGIHCFFDFSFQCKGETYWAHCLSLDDDCQVIEIEIYKSLNKRALSFERNHLISKMRGGLRIHFFDHCAKIMANPTHNLVDHWTKELYGACSWLQEEKVKSNKKDKPISAELIEQNFLNCRDGLSDFSAMLDSEYFHYTNNRKRDRTKDQEKYNKFKSFKKKLVQDITKPAKFTVDDMRELVKNFLI